MVWSPTSWQHKPCQQAIEFPDKISLAEHLETLATLPPLVSTGEIRKLRNHLALAEEGKAFILQGGDCAEQFSACRTDNIINKFRIIMQMSLVLIYGMHKPIIRVGRIAGQFAKPRSSSTETRGDVTLPAYRGDIVNRTPFDEVSRMPDPANLTLAYYHASATLNYIRALLAGGFADLHHPEHWDIDFMSYSPHATQYQHITESITNALTFLQTIDGVRREETSQVDFYASHEALCLPYEQALTRFNEDDGKWYNASTHFPWLGLRTTQIDGAHVEYLRGIHNPIGIKVGPNVAADDLLALIEVLNPNNERGRLCLITRFGANRVSQGLPPIIERVKASGRHVMWSCDPMHGNTQKLENGIKTRHFDDILNELKQTFAAHHACNSFLGGVHFEMTGENVTECTGGARDLKASDLTRDYQTAVDPRLNYEQALEMAILLSEIK